MKYSHYIFFNLSACSPNVCSNRPLCLATFTFIATSVYLRSVFNHSEMIFQWSRQDNVIERLIEAKPDGGKGKRNCPRKQQ